MGACISKDAESGIKKLNKKKSRKNQKIPDGTSGENASDLYSYTRETPSCSKASPSRSSNERTFCGGPSRPLKKYDRVIWMDEDNLPEKGTFKWTGTLDGERCVGLELDNKRTVSFGDHTGRKLFSCKPGHRAVVPLYQVMLVKDFETKLRTSNISNASSAKIQAMHASSSNKPKRKMRESVDRFYSGQGSVKKTKVEGDSSTLTSQQQSSTLKSNTISSYASSSAMASSTPNPKTTSDISAVEAPVPRRRVGTAAKDPTWSPGDRIKFRRSQDEAEILETKLELDGGLMMKIQYTEDSAKPGQIEISPLVDIMLESNLVKPPVLHQSLRRNSFLEAVTADSTYETKATSSNSSTLKKDEAIQTSMTALDEILSPPLFHPQTPVGGKQSTGAQTSLEFSPSKPSSTFPRNYRSIPHQLKVKVSQTTPPKLPMDVVDYYAKPWRPWPGSGDVGEFSYPGSWTESFRKAQRRAAHVGALKLQEQKQKLDKSLSSDELGDGQDDNASHNESSSDGTKLELERAYVQSPAKILEESDQRPLESPTLVKLARRNTYPLTPNLPPFSFTASAHPFSKQKMEFFDINMNSEARCDDGAKVVDVQMKPRPVSQDINTMVTTSKFKSETSERRPKSKPPELTSEHMKNVEQVAEVHYEAHGSLNGHNTVNVDVEVHEEENGKRGRPVGQDSEYTLGSKKRRKLCRPRLQKNALNIYPPFSSDDIQFGLGSQRGIGGMRNSCYIDAALFAMFYCTDLFDVPVLFNDTEDDLAKLATKYLQTIVFHLRGGGFCEGERIMKLRNAMKSDKVKGHFMDVEEFMFNLFEQTLKLPEFIHYYPDTKDYLTQIFVDNNDTRKYATVQELLETSFKLQDDLKLVSVPYPAWIVEMPRSNGKLVHYDAIIPTVHLKMSDLMMKVLNDGTVSCFCQIGKPPFWACQICHEESDNFNEKLTFCTNCKDSLITSLHDEMNHSPEPILYDPVTDSVVSNETIDNDLTMDLLTVICFKACHYTCFVKCGSGKDSTWIYFDSMTGTSSMVEEITEMNFWLNELEKDPKIYKNKNVPARVKQVLFDSHIYIYAPTPPLCPKSTAV